MSDPNGKDDFIKRFTPKNRIDDFLKKPDTRKAKDFEISDSKKKEFLRRQYTQKSSVKENSLKMKSFLDRRYQIMMFKLRYFRTKRFERFKIESLPMIIFFSFSTYIAFKMQSNLDQFNRKIIRHRSVRQEKLEEENRLIQEYLKGEGNVTQKQIQEFSESNPYDMGNAYEDEEDQGLMKLPSEEGYMQDLDADEMKELMEQYNSKTREMGYEPGPDPGYSIDAIKNQQMINKLKGQVRVSDVLEQDEYNKK